MPVFTSHTLLTCIALSGIIACSTNSDNSSPPANDTTALGSTDTFLQPTDIDSSDTQTSAGDTTTQNGSSLNTAPVTEAGPDRIGYRIETVIYTPIQSTEPRELRVAIWYPTDDTAGDATTINFGLLPIERPLVFSNAMPRNSVGPVLVYSHGNFGFAEAHYNLCEHFASHGWTVIAPDHTGNTWNSFSQRDTDTFLNRPQDLSACLDIIAPNAEQIAVVGHSFGGYTSLSLAGAPPDLSDCDEKDNTSDFCSLMDDNRRAAFTAIADDRIDLIVPMASGNSRNIAGDGTGVSNIDVPVFLLTGSLDNSNSNASDGDPYWDGLDGEGDRRLNLTNGGHQSFASTCLHYEEGLEEGDGCSGTEFIEPSVAIDIINEYVLAFARYHLTNDTKQKARLDGPAPDENIELSTK